MRTALQVEEPELPSWTVVLLCVAAILLPGASGTTAKALLLALFAAGAVGLFWRLAPVISNAVIRVAIPTVIATFFLLHLVLPGGSNLVGAAVGLPLAWLGVDQLRTWWRERFSPEPVVEAATQRPPKVRRDPPRSRTPAPPPPQPRRGGGRPAVRAPSQPRERCDLCGKDSFIDEHEAWNAVRRSIRRFEAGHSGEFSTPLDHAYYEQSCGNWHVSSQPQ